MEEANIMMNKAALAEDVKIDDKELKSAKEVKYLGKI